MESGRGWGRRGEGLLISEVASKEKEITHSIELVLIKITIMNIMILFHKLIFMRTNSIEFFIMLAEKNKQRLHIFTHKKVDW